MSYNFSHLTASERLHRHRQTEHTPDHIKRWTLIATILGSSMVFINQSTVNVALPALQESLGASVTDIQWILNAYTLMLASLILLGGALGDHIGRKRVFLLGTVIFLLASIWSGLAPSAQQLIVARVLQGIGGALLTPGSLAILSATFPAEERGQAIGMWSAFSALTTAGGPPLGGWLIDTFSWRWIFFIHVPFGLAVLWIAATHIVESRDEEAAAALDWWGALLVTVGLGILTFGLIRANNTALSDPLVLTSIISGLVILAGFVLVEARSNAPMVPLSLFQSSTFSGANGLTLLLYTALGGLFFFLPLNLIQVQGYTATQAGLALLPMILLLSLLSRWAGSLVDRVGARLPLTVGPLVAGVGFALFALPGTAAHYWTTFFPALLVLGLGMSICVAPLTTTVMTAVPDHVAGTASGINNAISRLAGLLSIALLGIVMVSFFSQGLAQNLAMLNLPSEVEATMLANRTDLANVAIPTALSPEEQTVARMAVAEAFVYGFRVVSWIGAALAFGSAAIAWWAIRPAKEK